MRPEKCEADVTFNCVTFLRKQGWKVRRKNVGLFYTHDGRPVRIGVPGEFDWECIFQEDLGGSTECRLSVLYFELEMKAPGKSPGKLQKEYAAKQRHLGFECVWFDGIKKLEDWYGELMLPVRE